MLQKWDLLFMGRCSGVARNFKREGAKFHLFCQAQFFFQQSELKQIEKIEKDLEGPGACSPGKFLKYYVL